MPRRVRAGGMACPRSSDKSRAKGPRRRGRSIQGGAGIHTGKKAFALRRHIVFDAEQSEGMSALEASAENVFGPIALAVALNEA